MGEVLGIGGASVLSRVAVSGGEAVGRLRVDDKRLRTMAMAGFEGGATEGAWRGVFAFVLSFGFGGGGVRIKGRAGRAMEAKELGRAKSAGGAVTAFT